MKKSIFTLAIAIVLAGTMITGCQSSTSKADTAKENLEAAEDESADAKQNLKIALDESIQQFKKESEVKMDAFEKSLGDLKAKTTTVTKDKKAGYEKKLALLKLKSDDLRKKLEDYTDVGQENWSTFKTEFNQEMDELELAFKDLSANTVK